MATQLLLLEDVDHVGRSGDIIQVKSGFARNFLIPKNLAVIADRSALRMQKRLQEERLKKAAEDKKQSEEVAAKLAEITLEISVKVDEEGHMYGSVSSLDILKMLEEKHGVVLEKRSIQLKLPIKKLGEHQVEVKLKEEVTGEVKLAIEAEEA